MTLAATFNPELSDQDRAAMLYLFGDVTLKLYSTNGTLVQESPANLVRRDGIYEVAVVMEVTGPINKSEIYVNDTLMITYDDPTHPVYVQSGSKYALTLEIVT